MTLSIHTHKFENGLVLLGEPNPSLESAAFTLLVPCGAVHDRDERAGLASFTCEMATRGAGDRDSRQLVEDLDNLGVERGESVSDAHTSFGGATLSKNLLPALEIYADLVRRPHLPGDQLEAARLSMLQELRAVEDEPAQKVMQQLRLRHYPHPFGRPMQGDLAGLEATSLDDIRDCAERLYRPNGSIIGVAGKFDWPRLKDHVGRLFGDWKPGDAPDPVGGKSGPAREHLHDDSNQTQIGIAYNSVPYRHPDYFQAWGAVGVLSGGMSSRLFTEVREKRGLCYSVYASYHTLRDRGAILCYAGTTAERAQETLDVTLGELRRLPQGIEASELNRLKARIKSGLIMQQESSSSRSGSIARDWYHLERTRTLDELGALVDGLTRESISDYLAAHPPGGFTIVTLGTQPLEMPDEVS
ncbi:MAG: M16 family metallopeptidase [Pirellulales bacterium]